MCFCRAWLIYRPLDGGIALTDNDNTDETTPAVDRLPRIDKPEPGTEVRGEAKIDRHPMTGCG
ncbi:hypothetical protein IU459_35585 [Nocardia amamiensis]|uniref:Transposase n=1 Tax=Nocardia amamiensis TaxID=404578 RepID=A0ABS0D2E6_9NOCA|nr:hypothetical protein [Nocardia amamiensis]MBF6302816.1 hypothetical protein [Nocardia amamiensis]